MRSWAGRVVLVTGASSGIGAALAREVASRGADVALLARRQARLETLAAELAAQGRRVLAVPCDVTDEAAVSAAVARVVRELGRLDVVVANAGFGVTGAVRDLTAADLRRQFEVNVFGVLHTIKASLEPVTLTKSRIVIMGSVAGYVSGPGSAAYGMSKFAVRALADSLRAELRPRGVSVTHVAPGFVESEIRRVDNHGVHHPEAPEPIPPWLVMPARVAARQIASAVDRRRPEKVVTGHGRIAVLLARYAPGLVRVIVGRARSPAPKARDGSIAGADAG